MYINADWLTNRPELTSGTWLILIRKIPWKLIQTLQNCETGLTSQFWSFMGSVLRSDLGSVKRSVMGSVMGSVVESVIEPAMGSEMASVMTFVIGSVRGSVMGSVMGSDKGLFRSWDCSYGWSWGCLNCQKSNSKVSQSVSRRAAKNRKEPIY